MKRVLLIPLLILALVLMLAACGEQQAAVQNDTEPEKPDNPVIKIGILKPAANGSVEDGSRELSGIKYASSVCPSVEIDGTTYDLVLTDKINEAAAIITLCDTTPTAEAVEKLEGVAVISPTCTENDFADISDSCFRVCYTDAFEAQALADFAKDRLRARTACCIAEEGNDASLKLCDAFMTAFKKGGGNIIYETIKQGEPSYANSVANAVKSKAEVFFAPITAEAGVALLEEAAVQKYENPILSGTLWDTELISETAHGKQVEVFVTAFYIEGQNVDFDEGYAKWCRANSQEADSEDKTEISSAAMKGYDAYFALVEAIKAAKSDKPADIKKALAGISFQGVCSEVTFSEKGNARNTLAYVKKCNIEQGGWDFVKKQFTDPVQAEKKEEQKETTAEGSN